MYKYLWSSCTSRSQKTERHILNFCTAARFIYIAKCSSYHSPCLLALSSLPIQRLFQDHHWRSMLAPKLPRDHWLCQDLLIVVIKNDTIINNNKEKISNYYFYLICRSCHSCWCHLVGMCIRPMHIECWKLIHAWCHV